MAIRTYQGMTPALGERVFVDSSAVVLGDVQLGDRILVGMGNIVRDGAVVEDEVVIGAGSLVPPGKRLVSGFLYVGSPVKQARPLSEKERAYFSYSASNYVKLKDLHLNEDCAN